MSNDHHLDVKIMGREYRVACTPDTEDALRDVVEYVDSKMSDIAAKTRNTIPERVAVMAALNIAHELLSKRPAGIPTAPDLIDQSIATELNDVHSRIKSLNARIDAAIDPEQHIE
jgi:cell division protein ZapA